MMQPPSPSSPLIPSDVCLQIAYPLCAVPPTNLSLCDNCNIHRNDFYYSLQMRLAHLGTPYKVGCLERNKLFADGVQEIADFLNQHENGGQIVRVYMNVSMGITVSSNLSYIDMARSEGGLRFLAAQDWNRASEA